MYHSHNNIYIIQNFHQDMESDDDENIISRWNDKNSCKTIIINFRLNYHIKGAK